MEEHIEGKGENTGIHHFLFSYEICRSLSDRVVKILYQTVPGMKLSENTVGKGENARNKHFLLFPQCFLLCQGKKFLFLGDL